MNLYTDQMEWNLSDLPPNWTVEDIEARAPQHIRKVKQVYRLTLTMPEHTDGYKPEFFLRLNMDDRDAARNRLQALVNSKGGRVSGFTLVSVPVARPDFINGILEILEKGN